MKIAKKQKQTISFPVCMIIVSAILIIAAGCKLQNPIPPYTIRDIPYGPDKENTMDISLPEGRTGDTPVIILVHGGAWTDGDKNDFSYLREYLSRKGFAAISVNYRLAKIKGTGMRNILDDMEHVISYVKEKSSQWTYSRNVIFLTGYSAGGHISLLYSFSRAAEGTISGVVSLCGLADLTDPELEKFLKRLNKDKSPLSKKPFDRIKFVMGPDRKMHIAYSPQFNTRNIPVLLICGKMDEIIPWSQSAKLHNKMKELGFDSTLYVYPDMGHDITPYFDEIIKITEKWIIDRI